MKPCGGREIEKFFREHFEELAEVSALARRVRDGIREIEPFIEEAARAVCPSCKKVCCVGKNSYYSYEDLIYCLALGLKMEELSGRRDMSPCGFLGARGCTVERALRPSGCNWYFCEGLYEYMEAAPGYGRFDDALRAVIADWTEMVREFLIRLRAEGFTVPRPSEDCSLFLSDSRGG